MLIRFGRNQKRKSRGAGGIDGHQSKTKPAHLGQREGGKDQGCEQKDRRGLQQEDRKGPSLCWEAPDRREAGGQGRVS